MLPKRNRRIVVVRHGERVDHRFQDAWVDKCFDSEGNYTRQNLNQPDNLPMRNGYPRTFIRDTPLTPIGCLQATLRGQGLEKTKVLAEGFDVYVSPSLRCVKTASNILQAMKINSSMKIEPCLFEWTQIKWYLNGNMPRWMSPEELSTAGFNVDKNYVPFITRENIKEGESVEAYYERSYNLLLHLLKGTENKDLLLVAHGFSMDALSRNLLGKHSATSSQHLLNISGKVPYCGMMILEQDTTSKKWFLPPLPSQLQLKHESAHEFDACNVFYD